MEFQGLLIELEYEDWMAYGIAKNWCGPPVCYVHDGLPTSEAEDEELCESDPCIHIVRMYEAPEDRLLIEDNHPPSQWRNSYGT